MDESWSEQFWLVISNVPESQKKPRKNRSGQTFRAQQYRTARKLDALLQSYPQHLRTSRSLMEPQVDSPYHLTQKPLKPIYPKQKDFTLKPYAALCCMQYILQTISPDTSFKEGLKALMKSCPLKQEKEMGFSEEWRSDPFWKWHQRFFSPTISYISHS